MAYLTLEDGTQFEGEWFGKKHDIIGEVVFNTGMSGYQEVLTDPSYCGQIVTMTYPLIGNYGVNSEDIESAGGPKVRGFIVRELCTHPSNWHIEGTLDGYLEKEGIAGLQGIDTRALTKIIRDKGVMRGILTDEKPTEEQMKQMQAYEITMPVDQVTTDKVYKLSNGKRKIAVLDLGLKRSILRGLIERDCTLTVFPARTSYEEILAGNFDGMMLTNGPGDPMVNTEVIENVRQLIGKLPMFGICLGHQIIALAKGAKTTRLKYGHRGFNHPVKDLTTGKCYITSQNHGYTIIKETLPQNAQIYFESLNDGTIEGLHYEGENVFSVQFHPEATPGACDTAFLFDEFMTKIDEV